ncbi:MAG: alcohol dehydrogenase [Chloroflexi bacterium RBG_13_68_17]|nr:MAG: alcohol dehydrogenase [Chloroflexi bacterium RBG_13_68_17]
MDFEFATAGRILFGDGVVRQAAALAAGHGRQVLLVTGGGQERAAVILDGLQQAGVSTSTFAVRGEPTLETARQAAQAARESGCQVVVGFGGGSPLDTAKMVAVLLTNGGDPLDYAEIIGRGQTFTRPSAPMLAIPTTAGTGTEATRNAVLSSPEHRVKVSLRSPYLLPSVALVDPELTHTLPPAPTAHTGMDALTQLIEPYVSARANPMTDGICVEGMRRVARSLRRAWERGRDAEARRDMAMASLFGGIALANAGLGAVHGFAGPFGGMFPEAPHGAVCACLLAPVTETNIRAAAQRDPKGRPLSRYRDVARLLTGQAQAEPEDAVAWLRDLCRDLEIPPLRAYGLTESDLPGLLERAAAANSMRSNPISLTAEEMRRVVDLAA